MALTFYQLVLLNVFPGKRKSVRHEPAGPKLAPFFLSV